jgi:hypothetical protein
MIDFNATVAANPNVDPERLQKTLNTINSLKKSGVIQKSYDLVRPFSIASAQLNKQCNAKK